MSRSVRVFQIAPLLAMAIAACGAQSAAPVNGSPAANAVSPPAQTAAKGSCTNQYMPVVNGATWTYAVTNSVNGGSTSNSAITAVAADSFTLAVKSSAGNWTETWSCNKDGLLQLQNNGGALGGTISGPDGTATITTTANTGLTLPANIKPGDSWTQRTDYSLTSTVGVSGTSTTTYTFTAVGAESVTVPAGTFTAMRVDMKVASAFTFADGNVLPSTSTASTWLVKGKGLAKMTMTTGIGAGSNSVSFDQELQSVQIP